MSDLCKGTTKAGNPCKSKPLTGSDYCRQHQIVERVAEAEEPKVDTAWVVCGHQNRHYTGDEPLLCDLHVDHEGAHSAEFNTVDYKEGSIIFEGVKRTHWTDEAGTPTDEIDPDYEALAKLIVERQIRQEAEKLKARA